MVNHIHLEFLEGQRERSMGFESVSSPNFPQPSHDMPPFFPALDEKRRSLDHPDLISTSRQHEIEQNVLLRSSFEFTRSIRHARLSRILKKHNKNRVVLVMLVNHGFMDMFLNWVRACDKHGIDPRSWALIFALDLETGRQIEQLGFTV